MQFLLLTKLTVPFDFSFLSINIESFITYVKIILKTDYNVRTNFDEKKDNTYYWYINKDNYKNKSINISVLKNNAIIEDNEKIIIGDNYINMFLYILVIIIIIIGLVILLKVKKSNK